MIVREIAHTSPQIIPLIIRNSTYIVYTVERCATQYNFHCTYFIILFIIIYNNKVRAMPSALYWRITCSCRGIIDMGTPYTVYMYYVNPGDFICRVYCNYGPRDGFVENATRDIPGKFIIIGVLPWCSRGNA